MPDNPPASPSGFRRLLTPGIIVRHVSDISPKSLTERGIRAVIS